MSDKTPDVEAAHQHSQWALRRVMRYAREVRDIHNQTEEGGGKLTTIMQHLSMAIDGLASAVSDYEKVLSITGTEPLEGVEPVEEAP